MPTVLNATFFKKGRMGDQKLRCEGRKMEMFAISSPGLSRKGGRQGIFRAAPGEFGDSIRQYSEKQRSKQSKRKRVVSIAVSIMIWIPISEKKGRDRHSRQGTVHGKNH